MLLRGDLGSKNALDFCISDYYKKKNRQAHCFLTGEDPVGGSYFVCCIVDRRHVLKYEIGSDREIWIGSISLAIGPHYFGPSDFWSYSDSERFSMDATTEAVVKNLMLLDEFWASP